jgi:hypothetical protein
MAVSARRMRPNVRDLPEVAILVQFTRANVQHRATGVGDQRTGRGSDRTRRPRLLRLADGRLWEILTRCCSCILPRHS